MANNIYKATNQGKGIIFLPPDDNEHPIVGACVSPRIPALDTINVQGYGNLPSWITQARNAACYNDTYDLHDPPIAVSTDYDSITMSRIECFGGYNMKVHGVVCPMHVSQGICRNGGHNAGRLKQISVYHAWYSDNTFNTSVKDSWRRAKSSNSSVFSYANNTKYWAACGGVTEIIAYSSNSTQQYSNAEDSLWIGSNCYDYGFYSGSNTCDYVDNILAAIYQPNISSGNKFAVPNDYIFADQFSKYSNCFRYRNHIYQTICTDVDDTIDLGSTTTVTSPYTPSPDPNNILYINNGIINSGVAYTDIAGTSYHFGKQTIGGTNISRDTTQGFLVGTTKGLIVQNELRRNFLRISPTVFKHVGGF